MINIKFPDGAIKQYEAGITAMDIAKSISHGLAKNVLSAKVNGVVWDTNRPILEDSSLALLTWDDAEAQSTFWHSSAHLMAEAIEALYPGTKFGIGPAIDNGFYYDIDPGDYTMSSDDFIKIEKKMQQLVQDKSEYVRKEISKKEAIAYFTEKGDEYKLELLEGLNDGDITFYTQGNFTDLCKGPHIPDTGKN
jgi:threonyl-tRNA synthetase